MEISDETTPIFYPINQVKSVGHPVDITFIFAYILRHVNTNYQPLVVFKGQCSKLDWEPVITRILSSKYFILSF